MTIPTLPEAVDRVRRWRLGEILPIEIEEAISVIEAAVPSPDLPPWHLVTTHVSFTLHANDGTERTTSFSAVEATFEIEKQEIDGVPMTRGKITTDWRPANV